jgi:HAD superfamily hydrolase (TIGR01490 family)
MKSLALFDFDGTLTNKDSLPDFIRFAVGTPKMVAGAVRLAPVLCAYAAKLTDNGSAKEKVLRHFFSGWQMHHLKKIGTRYALSRIPGMLRSKARERLHWHCAKGHVVAVVSASPGIWLEAWTQSLGLQLICTQLKEMNGRFAGRYDGSNCHGIEKVRRIRECFDLNEFDRVYAYGDTPGDRPMLTLADEAFYKPFRDR